MAEYTVFPDDVTYVELTDGTSTFRVMYESVQLHIAQAITEDGFAGTEDIDWAKIETYVLPSDPGAKYRIGERGEYWVIDQCYDPVILGFGGDEGWDWDNIEMHKLP